MSELSYCESEDWEPSYRPPQVCPVFEKGQKLYRYFDNFNGKDFPAPRLTKWKVVRVTKCGAWISEFEDHYFSTPGEFLMCPNKDPIGDKWINKDSYRPYAWRTEELALASYRVRKMKHLKHVEDQYEYLKKVMAYLDKKEEKDECIQRHGE